MYTLYFSLTVFFLSTCKYLYIYKMTSILLIILSLYYYTYHVTMIWLIHSPFVMHYLRFIDCSVHVYLRLSEEKSFKWPVQLQLYTANSQYTDYIWQAQVMNIDNLRLIKVLKGHCLIFLSAIYQLFIEYFNIK